MRHILLYSHTYENVVLDLLYAFTNFIRLGIPSETAATFARINIL